jgi:hypothetical protein
MEFGRPLVLFGLVVVFVGLPLMFLPELGLGRLPGNISIRRCGVSFHFPIATSIVLSILLTILLNLFPPAEVRAYFVLRIEYFVGGCAYRGGLAVYAIRCTQYAMCPLRTHSHSQASFGLSK